MASIQRILFLLTFCVGLQTIGQTTDWQPRAFRLTLDNDLFTLDKYADQYYTQGVFVSYQWVDTTHSAKRIHEVGLAQRVFTPEFVSYDQLNRLDRPYAGQLSLLGSTARFSERAGMRVQLELGVMGSASGAEAMQTVWHKVLNTTPANGWEFQMPNSLILNGYFMWSQSLIRSGNFQLLSENHLAAGTVFTHVRPELLMRFGRFSALDNSALYGSNLGWQSPSGKELKEVFLLLSVGAEMVLHNGTIEGALIGQRPVHTEEPKRWVRQFRGGLFFAWKRGDLSAMYVHRTPETTEATYHKWAGFTATRRF